jgi:hypothetical protein
VEDDIPIEDAEGNVKIPSYEYRSLKKIAAKYGQILEIINGGKKEE